MKSLPFSRRRLALKCQAERGKLTEVGWVACFSRLRLLSHRLESVASPGDNALLSARFQSLFPALLLLLPWLLLWRLWTPFSADRQVFAYGDFVEQFYPLRRFAADALKAGRLPLWNPHIFGGTPALADPQWATLYPPAWLSAFIPPWPPLPFEVLQAEAVVHLGLAGLFTFLFARRFLPPLPAFVAGLVFELGGYLTSYPPLQLAVLETAAWLPVVLLAADVLATPGRRTAMRITLAAVALALAFLAGHPQTFLLILYTALAYYVVRAWRRLTWRLAVGRGMAALTAAVGLTAAQWLPTLQLARLGPRLILPYEEAAVGFSLPEMAQIVLPNAFGVWSPLYVGAAALLLALIAVARGRGRFWAVLAVAGLLLSLGAGGGLYWLAYHAVPGFSLFRHQERTAVLWSFGLAILAGYGLAALPLPSSSEDEMVTQRRRDAKEEKTFLLFPLRLRASAFLSSRWLVWIPAALVGMAALALLVAWTARGQPGEGTLAAAMSAAAYSALMLALAALLIGRVGHGWRVALVALIALDLLSTSGRGLLQTPPPGGYFAPNPLVWRIQADANPPFRVSSEGLLPPGGGNGAVLWDLQDVVGNSPLHFAAYDALIADAPELVWWRLLGVRYVLTKREIRHGALTEIDRQGDTRLYTLAGGMPAAWIAPGVQVVADDAAVRAALGRPDFDPAKVAVTSASDAAGLGLPLSGDALDAASAEVARTTPEDITVSVTTPTPGLLVLSEAYAPGWQAWVNGAPSPVWPVDGLLQATPLPAGASTVEFRYRPWTVTAGLAVSVLTLVALVALTLWRYPAVAVAGAGGSTGSASIRARMLGRRR